MENNNATFFNPEFLATTLIRRRKLMPLALKIYVWYYIIAGVLAAFGIIVYYKMHTDQLLSAMRSAHGFYILISLSLSSPVRAVFNLIIWQERRLAIRWSFVISAVYLCSEFFNFYLKAGKYLGTITMISAIIFIVIDIPYLVLLLRVRKDWELKGVPVSVIQQL